MQKGTKLGKKNTKSLVSRETRPDQTRTPSYKKLGNNTTPSSLTSLIIKLSNIYHILQRA